MDPKVQKEFHAILTVLENTYLLHRTGQDRNTTFVRLWRLMHCTYVPKLNEMLKKIGVLIAACFLLTQTGKGQLADKATFFGGFTYQVVSMTPLGSPQPWRFPFYGLSLGMDYVLLHSNDQFSLGVNPNANFSFMFSSLFGTSLLAQAPVFMLGRIGAGATPYNEQKVGVGAGIGANYTYMLHTTPIYDSNGGFIGNFRINEGFLSPSAVVELSVNSRFSNYLFRFNWSLARPSKDVDNISTEPIPFRFGAAGLSILYTF